MSSLHKNRGMLLETIINQTNQYYLTNNICLIHKKNLDITFESIDLKDKKLKLKNAYIKNKSSVDYYGVYNGKFLAFEAKSTEDSILPLANIKNHQIEYLDLIQKHQGIAFWIIFYKIPCEFILIMHEDFKKLIANKKALHYEEAISRAKKLTLLFPGILNIIENIIF
ncbi:Holliday junction resolvase RecU [Mycoplasma enhydrae]|uniref:Holliday junction resolvase RecU n=1 Tax=Mycoplasma enhydrae TaxID=2499220 RepID=UPI0021E82B99|nr:Holliday junction resolvase RecU [Mycoplasma enhydrae]MCV3733630.1 Holliday junction resolvase RecU [Mycoplasma enhydrae]